MNKIPKVIRRRYTRETEDRALKGLLKLAPGMPTPEYLSSKLQNLSPETFWKRLGEVIKNHEKETRQTS